MRRSNLDLLALVGLAAAQVLLAVAPSFGGDVVLRTLVGVPMALYAPGCAIVAAIWPSGGLQSGERPALSIGSSFGLATLGGLTMFWAGVGFQPLTWAVLLGVPTVLGVLAALVRRMDAAPGEDLPRQPFTLPAPGLIAAAAALTIGAVAFSAVSASRPREQFSELWLVRSGSTDGVDIGLRSMEQRPTRYRIQVLDGAQVALDTSDIELAPGQAWQTSLELADRTTTDAIQAIVYRADAPDIPYRRVELRPAQKG